jgi:Zn-finger protein
MSKNNNAWKYLPVPTYIARLVKHFNFQPQGAVARSARKRTHQGELRDLTRGTLETKSERAFRSSESCAAFNSMYRGSLSKLCDWCYCVIFLSINDSRRNFVFALVGAFVWLCYFFSSLVTHHLDITTLLSPLTSPTLNTTQSHICKRKVTSFWVP